MAKWYGIVGYADTVENEAGEWVETIMPRSYYGDVYRNSRLLQTSGGVNDNVNVAMQISIVADPFASENFHAMRYVEYMGTYWKVTNVEVQYPRLILTIGEKWNGYTA